MLNKVIVMGRITRELELNSTRSGVPVMSFSIAVERPFRGEDGSRKTDFLDIVAWRGAAEFIARNFSKGQTICVEGRLQPRDWTDAAGHNRHTVEIVAEEVYFCDNRRKLPDDPMPEETAQEEVLL